MCLVVFQKIFRKIFFSVWKILQGKRQNQKNKHSTQIDARVRLALTAFDGDRRCSTARSIDRDRREGEFTISDRDRRRWCLRTAPTGAWTCERRRLGLCLPLALSLSLSLSLWNSFEVKIGTEIHFRSQSLFFLGQRKSISGKFYFPDQPNTRISRKAFPEMIFTQNKHSLNGLSVTCWIVGFVFRLFYRQLFWFIYWKLVKKNSIIYLQKMGFKKNTQIIKKKIYKLKNKK